MELAIKVVVFVTCLVGVTIATPCPAGCRCHNPVSRPHHHSRHNWHRLLATYRLRSAMYGQENAGHGWDVSASRGHGVVTGPEITCIGLPDIPDNLPPDVTKLVMYGDSRRGRKNGASYLQDAPEVDADSDTYGPMRGMTSLFKRALYAASGTIRELTLEGNKIRSLSDHELDILRELRVLRLRNNRIRTLTPGAFGQLFKLEELDLSQNQFRKISQTTFANLVLLRKINLSQNRLRGLHARTFRTLTNLRELDLSSNSIHYMGRKIFVTNIKLTVLNLNHNDLTEIKPEWFFRVPELTRLSIQSNKITSVPSGAFRRLMKLKHLSLSYNHISVLEPRAFAGLPELLTLQLTKNNMTRLGANAFADLRSLKELSLKENAIEEMNNDSLVGLSDLRELDLSWNSLDFLNREAFMKATMLQHLDVSHNQIKTITRRNIFGLHELRELKLHHNLLQHIEDEGFAVSVLSAYSKLTWLYLDHNQLSTISRYTLYGLAYVKYLNLGHNHMESIGEGALSKLGRLHTLMLNNNNLQHLYPDTFEHLAYLHHINLAANRLRHVDNELFNRLEKVEDINVSDNDLEEISPESFSNTPHLQSLDLRRNRLRNIDFGILEQSPRLKYLDVSRNIISQIQLPHRYQRQLYFLSLADNNFLHLPPEVEKTMAFNGDLHLYGNPWSCDCGLRWITELDDRRLNLPVSDEIVCKSPASLSGEQVMLLEPSDFLCAPVSAHYEEDDWPRDDPSLYHPLSCDFMEHAIEQNTRDDVKASKDDVMDWMVLFLNDDDSLFCSGIRLSNSWVLTRSECWKHWNLGEDIMIKFSSFVDPKNITEDDLSYQYTDIRAISHYTGNVDMALVRLGYVREENEKRVFPCILSEDSVRTAASASKGSKIHGIMTARASYVKNPAKVKFRGFPFKVLDGEDCEVSDQSQMCVLGNAEHSFGERFYMNNNFFFVKVGRSRWALAGVNMLIANENVMTEEHQMTVTPAYEALAWFERALLF